MPRLPRPPVVALCLMAGLVVGLAACGDDDDTADGPTADATVTTSTTSATTAPATTTEPAPTPEQEVEAAYLEAAAVLDRAFLASNPADIGLRETRIDPSLSNIQELLADRSEAGAVLAYPNDLPPEKEMLRVTITSSSTATIDVCVIDNALLVDEDTGEVLDDSITARLTRNQMRLDGQTWKVESVDELSTSPDAWTCAEPDADA